MAKTVYTKINQAIVEVLKANPDGLTIAEIAEATGLPIISGHVVGTMKKGLIEAIGEKEVSKVGKRKVDTYEFVTDEPQMNAEGKAWNYTDGEKALLAVAKNFEGPFTLAELAAALGKERMTSGSVNSLVNKKGNLRKGTEVKFVETVTKSSVNVYGFVKDIPADAEIR